MRTPLPALILLSAFLTSCASNSPRATCPNVKPFLQPTLVDGPHSSLRAVMADPQSTTRALVDFGGASEDATLRCNADKASALRLLEAK